MSLNQRFSCRFFSLALSFMLLLHVSQAQTDFSSVDEILSKNQKAFGTNVVTLIMKDGKLIYQKEMGDFNLKTAAPIASCSKWLTAALAMKMVEEGKIDLDAPVAKYLPIFSKYMKNYITIRHCLTHTTGLEFGRGLSFLQRKKFASLEEEVNAIAAKEIRQKPGENFHYGGIGLNIVGRVLEIVTKKSFDRLMQDKITRPLKMRATNFSNDGGAVNPSGGARSTAQDYMNFLSMLLNDGVFDGKQILSRESVELMCKVQTNDAKMAYVPAAAADAGYGFGCWIQERDENGNGTVVSSPGLFGTWPYIDRKRKYACIIFTKTLLGGEQKRELYDKVRLAIEEEIKN